MSSNGKHIAPYGNTWLVEQQGETWTGVVKWLYANTQGVGLLRLDICPSFVLWPLVGLLQKCSCSCLFKMLKYAILIRVGYWPTVFDCWILWVQIPFVVCCAWIHGCALLLLTVPPIQYALTLYCCAFNDKSDTCMCNWAFSPCKYNKIGNKEIRTWIIIL